MSRIVKGNINLRYNRLTKADFEKIYWLSDVGGKIKGGWNE